MRKLMSDTSILTAAGRYFDFKHPERCDIDIEEIAHALSHICRYTGHVRHFYSVAQHSVMVSGIVLPCNAMAGLLHDSAEAFLGDVSTPLKALLPDYKEIEANVELAVRRRFGLPARLPYDVKRADLVALATEERALMPKHDDKWMWELVPGIEPLDLFPAPECPREAKANFLARYHEIKSR